MNILISLPCLCWVGQPVFLISFGVVAIEITFRKVDVLRICDPAWTMRIMFIHFGFSFASFPCIRRFHSQDWAYRCENLHTDDIWRMISSSAMEEAVVKRDYLSWGFSFSRHWHKQREIGVKKNMNYNSTRVWKFSFACEPTGKLKN